MLINVSNKTLGAIFATLVALLVLVYATKGDGDTFERRLAVLDSASVSEIRVYPRATGGEEIRLFLEDSVWRVALPGGASEPVERDAIEAVFKNLATIEATRLVSRDTAAWAKFLVNDVGTRVTAYADEKIALDVIFGKFRFEQPRTMYTYARLAGEDEVYEVEGFFDPVFNQDRASFRDRTIVGGDFREWDRAIVSTPTYAYALIRTAPFEYEIGGAPADSLAAANYLRELQNLQGASFLDDVSPDELINPRRSVSISANGEADAIVVHEYAIDSATTAIVSSRRPDAVFDATGVAEKIFVEPTRLRKP
jgi:hypothetical protein